MYEEFFGLTEKPFSIQPDPSFLYWGRGHRLAYAMLEYGVLNHAGISVVTGEIGCGKTTLIHRLLDQLSDTHSVALLSNIQQGRGDLLSWVLMGFGQPFAGKTHVELFSQLQHFFIEEYSRGRRVVLIIDEAQNLSVDMLEELRMLSNINAGKDQLLQLILVGQPELKGVLNRPDMLQLAQRIGSDFHLTPLSRPEVDAYIETRMTIAGAQQRVFDEEAVDLIAEHSRGVPRVINIIADTALVYAFSAQSATVGADMIRDVVRDKKDYGVFGLATETDLPQPAPDKGGPSAYTDAPAPVRPRPALREVPPAPPTGRDDTPRMPAPVRQRARSKTTALAEEPAPAPAAAAPAPARPAPAAQAAQKVRPAADRQARSEPAPVLYAPDPAPTPAPAPTPSAAPSSAPAPESARIGVVVIGAGGDPAETIRSAGGDRALVFIVQDTDETAVAAARDSGVDVVQIADRALSPGRARNAGYRHLKKQYPDLDYVQFVEAGFHLDPAWLDTAMRFMERRPEVAAVEGEIGEAPGARSLAASAAKVANAGEPGEIQVAGPTVLVRTDAFEAAGGFRGDLAVNETQDLCIRFRRRGAHIWRVDALMGERRPGRRTVGDWWAHAWRAGFEYAHGATLHGAAPEYLYAAARRRALIWGAFLPAFILTAAASAAAASAALAPASGRWPYILAGVLAAGGFLYLFRIFVVAILRGPVSPGAWAYAALSTIGFFPEVFGVWRYHAGGGRRVAARKAAS